MSIYYYLSAFLFCLGLLGTVFKKDLISMLLCLELMLSSVSLLFILFSKSTGFLDAQLLVIFSMIISACEVAIGLSLIISLYRKKQTIYTDDIKIITE
ncbi:MAG: NADH-quinone oxidoreductase subunit NuoK [Bacteriovorax sp.]|nr:NADH-quinone oxidoreductase subunit NuoK [Bacteriovorax sp.]